MAAISDSAIDGFNSPQPRRSRNLSSPWSHVVRGGDAEVILATSHIFSSSSSSTTSSLSSSSSSPFVSESDREKDNYSPEALAGAEQSESVATKAKKPAWNKPSNGVVEINNNLMGASWPALSVSARLSPKSSSDSLKALADGSVAPSPASHVTVVPSSPRKSNTNNANPSPSSTPKKSTKRSGGNANNGGPQPPPSVEMNLKASDKPAMLGSESSPRDASRKNTNSETVPRVNFGLQQQPHGGNDQSRPSFRRSNSGGPHRGGGGGDGNHHGNYGSRRDQNFEWSPHQSFNGRDIHMRQPRPIRNFPRQQPPTPPPFITSVPVRPYASPMGFPDLRSPIYYVPPPPPESLSGVVPYVAHPAPPGMFMSTLDPQLRAMLVNQIDYYFSPENLCRDIYLRQNMDEQGWVPISLIANFNRVKHLMQYIPFILEAVRTSTVVEVQGDKIRKRNDWMNWLLPPPNLYGTATSRPQSPNYDSLATRMQNMGLEGTAANHSSMRAPSVSHAEVVLTRSLSAEPSSQRQRSLPTGNINGADMGSDNSISLRNLEKSISC